MTCSGQLPEIPQRHVVRFDGQKILRRGEGEELGHPLRLSAVGRHAEIPHRHAVGLGRVDLAGRQMRLAVAGRIAPVGHNGRGRRLAVQQLGARHLGDADVLREHVDRGQVVERDRPGRQRVAPAVPRGRVLPDHAHVGAGRLAHRVGLQPQDLQVVQRPLEFAQRRRGVHLPGCVEHQVARLEAPAVHAPRPSGGARRGCPKSGSRPCGTPRSSRPSCRRSRAAQRSRRR